MEGLLEYIMNDDNPFTHPMLVPVTAFGFPVEPETKTGPIGGSLEPERAEQKIVKERFSWLLDSNKCGTNQEKF